MSQTTGGALMVVGATSNAGKSTVVQALCRALARRGLPVAPFKAQNMSNHAAVTADGGEIGRAQAAQAEAARVELDRRMNPVLLKPRSDLQSQVVVLGEEINSADALGYQSVTESLKPTVLQALTDLRSQHHWVVAEGAGGAAEINLLERDLVNLPLAYAAGIPAILVVDIELGGAFAAAFGTISLLPPHLRRCIRGVVINRFRGDPTLLESGLRDLEHRSGVPVLGVLPFLGDRPLLGGEDALDIPVGTVGSSVLVDAAGSSTSDGTGTSGAVGGVRVAAVRLPHLANASDLDPLLTEPDVALRWVIEPSQLVDADLIVLPGSRATVADLGWLRATGLAEAIQRRDPTTTLIGLCAGYQMLGTAIDDPIESGQRSVEALGLLPVATRFQHPKIVRRSSGRVQAGPNAGSEISGYQIRFGRPNPLEAGRSSAVDRRSEAGQRSGAGRPWFELEGEPEGTIDENRRVHGTSLHGLFDTDRFRQAVLASVAEARGRRYRPALVGYRHVLDHQYERLADWVEEHLDLNHLLAVAATAATPGQGPGWKSPATAATPGQGPGWKSPATREQAGHE